METVVVMPKLGLTMVEGTVVGWRKSPGDPVAKGDILVEVMTDKISMEVEAQAEGFLRKVLAPEGSVVPVAEPIAVIGDSAGSPASEEDFVRATPAAKRCARGHGVDLRLVKPSGPRGLRVERDVMDYLEQDQPASPRSRVAPGETGPAGGRKATPMAARLASELGIDLGEVPGEGRVSKDDVLAAATAKPQGSAVSEPPTAPTRLPLAGMRRVIAQRMLASVLSAPQVTINMEADLEELVRLRERLNRSSGGESRISFTDLLVKIAARALVEFPLVNGSIIGDEILIHPAVNIGVAVALDDGLIVPVVKGADAKSLAAISDELKDLAGRGRTGGLLPGEISGGTFTISNLGMYGVDSFTPIINPPESAILGLNRIAEKPVVSGGQVLVRRTMNLSLSFDHRLIDGALAARFLARIKSLAEEPALLLV